MNSYDIKRRAALLLNSTTPSPYFVTIALVIITNAISTILINEGGQPFTVNMDAYAAGNYDAVITFAPESISTVMRFVMLAAEILFVLLEWGYQSYCLHVARRQASGFFDLMDGFLIFFRALVLQIVRGVLIYIGMLLFILPGILLAYIYSMSQRIMLDNPKWSPFRCMRESRKLMQGRLKEYFLLRLSLLIWNIIAILPVTSILAKPYVSLCLTEYYLQITGTGAEETDDTGEKPPWEY